MSILLRNVRVLLVEDHADTLDLTSLVFTSEGALVTTASTAAEATEHLRSHSFDVLVSDIGLPGGSDGNGLIRELRASGGPNAKVPAVALSAYARDVEIARALEAGFDLHAAKPITPADLVRLVVGLLAQRL